MRLLEVTFSALLPAGIQPRLVPPQTPLPVWRVVVLTKAGEGLAATDFIRSVQAEVDDDSKAANFIMMLYALFSAIKQDNFHQAFQGLAVQCKEAHSFKYKTIKERLWELKYGKKDRIYFYTLSKSKTIVLLEAHHKKDQTTPKEVKSRSESAIKRIVDNASSIEIIKGPKS
ncbi:type II toxin-antitoxin system RelE/ParE family toxin [Cupriavidus oxalaticus]|uniref:type II toxin-antitoxin system RelE/ParE family toxin n=1 Tax=Cupriavidus oxalaticus TaxID=96344 RepID=UPI004034811F